MTFYLDTSAIIKLVIPEKETQQLKSYLGNKAFASSELAHVEIFRSLRRLDVEVSRGTEILRGIFLLEFNSNVAKLASLFAMQHLGAIDAIHIATAMSNDLSTFITYDKQQSAAAVAIGLKVVSPGVD